MPKTLIFIMRKKSLHFETNNSYQPIGIILLMWVNSPLSLKTWSLIKSIKLPHLEEAKTRNQLSKPYKITMRKT